MACEAPSSKKRKVLQPTIKCFMNVKHPQPDQAASSPGETKGKAYRQRPAPRGKASVFRDQPPINIFMTAEEKAKVQNENNDESPKPESPKPESPCESASCDDDVQFEKELTQAERAAKLDIKLSPEIIMFMKSVCLRHPGSRTQADMTLLQLIIDFNPHLKKSDEPLVWVDSLGTMRVRCPYCSRFLKMHHMYTRPCPSIRMQKSLAQMAIKVQEEMMELRRQREAAAAQAAAAAAAAAEAAAAAFQAHQAQQADRIHFLRMQQEEAMRRQSEQMKRLHERRERERMEKERRERCYNQLLYNQLHSISSGTNLHSAQPAPQASPSSISQQQQQQQQRPTSSEAQWETLRQTVLRQIGSNDKDSATLVRYIYANFPPKGKIRVGDEAIAQIAQLQRSHDPNAKKKLKLLLLKVIQDYHPDKVDDQLGEKWKSVSEDIVKRVTKYYEALK